MKRICSLVVLMLLSSSAHAGNSFSFVVGGHRIHIGAARHCRSASCVLVSIPKVYETRRGRDRNEDRDEPAPAKPVAAAPSLITPPASKAPIQPVASAPPQATVALAASTTREVAPPASTPPPASGTIIVMPAPAPPPIEPPPLAAPPAAAAPPAVKISHEDDVPTPLGDWQTEGKKGSVRIEPCGHALCGYVLNPSSNAAGETLLINMKPKTASDKTASEKAVSTWSGNIFSRDSGNTYYATMTMKSPNLLRVEACALGKFFCSGNVWTRIGAPSAQVTSTQESPAPRS